MGKPLVRFCEGSGYNSGHGRDIVAPPRKQAANRENKLRPKVTGVPIYSKMALFFNFRVNLDSWGK
jgi:hypothetical protein